VKNAAKPTPPPAVKPPAPNGVESEVVEIKKPVEDVAADADEKEPEVKEAPAAEEAPAAAEDANLQTYTVKEGEDVYAVAIRWGVSPNKIKTLNNLKSIELKPGTVIKIPSVK